MTMYKLKRLTPEIIIIIVIILTILIFLNPIEKPKSKQQTKAIVIDITKDSLSIDSVKNDL